MQQTSRLAFLSCLSCLLAGPAQGEDMAWIKVGPDKKSFVLDPSGKKFVPWGFNYDHDEKGRFIEDYWEAEWPKVEADFAQMQKYQAKVVRVQLQLGKFMEAADQPNEKALERLGKLLGLAERSGLYLDLTGLGCYRKKEVPEWYDKLSEKDRWEVQTRFWEAVAGRCAKSPAVFCYDLMNEPRVPSGLSKEGWLPGPHFFGMYFNQHITLDQQSRERPEIASQWLQRLTAAVRKQDPRHLITLGMLPPEGDSGFLPKKVVNDLDFLCVHVYPKGGKVDEALKILADYSVGKPVLIEETYPLRCSLQEQAQFLEGSKKHAAGWLAFYWSQTPEEYRQAKHLKTAEALELFVEQGKAAAASQ